MKKFYTLVIAAIFGYYLSAQTTLTFNYTGSMQTFTVPANVFLISVDASGAKGADNGTAAGGSGGRVQGFISVNPGDVLNIFVGGAGVNSLSQPTSTFDGGGGVYSYASCGTAGTGGGGTDIRLNGITLNDRILVAGGGGGAGGATNPVQYCAGGNGGGLTGATGVPWNTWPQSAGGGGSQSTGGIGGVACCSCPQYTTSGVLGAGGTGSGDCAGGGGGGGGYYGGGGSCFGGGGGGSSYTGTPVSQVTHTQGYQAGNGVVILSYNVSTTSTTEFNILSTAVYPNPFQDMLYITLPEFAGQTYELTDITGRIILSGVIEAHTNNIPTTSLNPGAYILSVYSAEGKLTRTLVKKN